jgi:DNA polymerase-3 subunit delta'
MVRTWRCTKLMNSVSIMSFKIIEGHDKPVAILKRACLHNTLAHAYLFSGEKGIGKKLTAYALAAAVNCGDAGPEGGCGICPSCRRTAALTHPDIHLVMPESEDERFFASRAGSNADKPRRASDEIKIDQIRLAQESISLRPSEGRKKVLIIDGAEALNDAAQNAFLKTLEEPPGDCLIILVSSRPQSLLPTIRSRCQEIRFQPLPRRTLAEALARKRGISGEDAWFLAALAEGSMGRGLEMDLKQERDARDEVMALWNGLGSMSPAEVLSQAESLCKDRDRLERFLDIGIEWLRDTLVFRETRDERLLVQGRAGERQWAWGERFSVPRMLADLELFFKSRALLDRRVSAQLVAENLLFKLGRG